MKRDLILRLEDQELKRDLLRHVIKKCSEQIDGFEKLMLTDLPPTRVKDERRGRSMLKRYVVNLNKNELSEGKENWTEEEMLAVFAWSKYFLGKVEMAISLIGEKLNEKG